MADVIATWALGAGVPIERLNVIASYDHLFLAVTAAIGGSGLLKMCIRDSHHDGRRARGLVLGHDIAHVHRIAEAGIDVRDQGNGHGGGDGAHHFQVGTHGQDVGIRHRVAGRQLEAATPDAAKAGLFGQPGHEGIVGGHGGKQIAAEMCIRDRYIPERR